METAVPVDRTLTPPSVSVCMIAYNQENYVAQAIEGVLAQQGAIPTDLIIGEDCSTDATRAVCESYARQHPDRIRLLPSAANLGVMANFFRTLGHATGKYVAFCEGDDYWCDPDKLLKQVAWLESHPECGLVYSQVRWYFDSEQRFDRDWGGPESGETTLERLLEGNCIPTPSVVIRRDLLERYIEEVRPQERNWMMGDYPMWLYAAAHAEIRFINDPLAGARSTSAVISPGVTPRIFCPDWRRTASGSGSDSRFITETRRRPSASATPSGGRADGSIRRSAGLSADARGA